MSEFSRKEYNKEFELESVKVENEKYVAYLHEKAERKYKEQNEDRDLLKKKLKTATDEEMMIYVPDIYQESIYKIDYVRLKQNEIKLLTFDIDDTIDDSIYNKARGIVPGVKVTMPKEAKKLFIELKEMGFKTALLTNAGDFVAKDVYEDLQTDDYIPNSRKPQTTAFEEIMKRFDVKPSEVVHIGNSMRDDVVGGNRAGVITCLIRRNGYTIKVGKKIQNIFGHRTKGQLIREELKKRKMWRKHHKYEKDDQYYQLGEKPKYLG